MAGATPLDVMVEVTKQPDWREKAEDHRRMARAAIRVAMRRGATTNELADEYDAVVKLEGGDEE